MEKAHFHLGMTTMLSGHWLSMEISHMARAGLNLGNLAQHGQPARSYNAMRLARR